LNGLKFTQKSVNYLLISNFNNNRENIWLLLLVRIFLFVISPVIYSQINVHAVGDVMLG
jgi:hypothetical protein